MLIQISADNDEVASVAERLYARLQGEGIEVLYDDRVESPGVKLNDADLLGMPLRLVLSPRTLKSRSIEVKGRSQEEAAVIPLKGVVQRIKGMLSA